MKLQSSINHHLGVQISPYSRSEFKVTQVYLESNGSQSNILNRSNPAIGTLLMISHDLDHIRNGSLPTKSRYGKFLEMFNTRFHQMAAIKYSELTPIQSEELDPEESNFSSGRVSNPTWYILDYDLKSFMGKDPAKNADKLIQSVLDDFFGLMTDDTFFREMIQFKKDLYESLIENSSKEHQFLFSPEYSSQIIDLLNKSIHSVKEIIGIQVPKNFRDIF